MPSNEITTIDIFGLVNVKQPEYQGNPLLR